MIITRNKIAKAFWKGSVPCLIGILCLPGCGRTLAVPRTSPVPPTQTSVELDENFKRLLSELGKVRPYLPQVDSESGTTMEAKKEPKPLPTISGMDAFRIAWRARSGIEWEKWKAETLENITVAEKAIAFTYIFPREAELQSLIVSKKEQFSQFNDVQKKVVLNVETAYGEFKDQGKKLEELHAEAKHLTTNIREHMKAVIKAVDELESLPANQAESHIANMMDSEGAIGLALNEVEQKQTTLQDLLKQLPEQQKKFGDLGKALETDLDALKSVHPDAAPLVVKAKDDTAATVKSAATAAAAMMNPLLGLLFFLLFFVFGGGGGDGGDGGGGKPGNAQPGNSENSSEKPGPEGRSIGVDPNTADRDKNGDAIPENAKPLEGLKYPTEGDWLIAGYELNGHQFLRLRHKTNAELREELPFDIHTYGAPFMPLAKAQQEKTLEISEVHARPVYSVVMNVKTGDKPMKIKWREAGQPPVVLGGNPVDPVVAADRTVLPLDISSALTDGSHSYFATRKGDEVTLHIQIKKDPKQVINLPFPAQALQIDADGGHWCLTAAVQLGDDRDHAFPIELLVANGGDATTHSVLWLKENELPAVRAGGTTGTAE